MPLGALLSPDCSGFPPHLLVWSLCFMLEVFLGYLLFSVIPYVLRFTKLLGSCAYGWGLLPETFTKVILSAELFYFAHMPTGYWPGLWCFVFL